MSTKRKVEITDQQMSDIIAIIDKYRDDQGALIPVLHEVQDYFGYLPIEVQKVISDELHVPLAEIYGVGTACYVKGAGKILEKFENALGIKAGEVTDDGMFSLDACRCIGACGLAPVATVNGEVYGKLVQADVQTICDKYMNE